MFDSPIVVLRNYIKGHKGNNKSCDHCNQSREVIQLLKDLESCHNTGADFIVEYKVGGKTCVTFHHCGARGSRVGARHFQNLYVRHGKI